MDQQTIDTYNQNASRYAADYENFAEANSRFISHVLSLVPNQNNPLVVDLGCGNGRDAEVIKKYTQNYLGIDASSEMIKLAQTRNPELKFMVGNIAEITLPENIDLVMAFASLLHLTPEELDQTLSVITAKLKSGGLLAATCINGQGSFTRNDDKGPRLYFRYTPQDLLNFSPQLVVEELEETSRIQLEDKWFRIILKKK